tara:strand:- start:98 stop:613 length:516 start_codon:yes stop_codon:yes gene_type:complete
MDKNRDFEEVISGNVNLHVVDILDNLRTELSSTGVLTRKIGRKELITVVDELIDALPVELRTARWIVREQQSFLSKARQEGEEILENARNESEKLISESYVIKEAVIEANALLKKAEIEVQSDRAKIEDEIDSVLTNLESTLGELLGIINTQKEALRKPRVIETPEEEQGD